jgi:hypothetical protein
MKSLFLYFVTDPDTVYAQRSAGHEVLCSDFGDISRHALSADFEVTSEVVWVVMNGDPKTVPMENCVRLEKSNFKHLNSGNCLLVPAVRLYKPPPQHLDTITARREVDFLMSVNTKIRNIPAIVFRYKNTKLTRRNVEDHWQSNLVFKDIEFLKETQGRHLALQYDTTPLDKQSQFSGGHLTATWIVDEDEQKWHHLKTYITNVQTAEAFEQSVKGMVEYSDYIKSDSIKSETQKVRTQKV